MKKTEFIKHLRSAAAELKPYADSAGSGSRVWNGTAYVEGDIKTPDPYALSWHMMLGAIADIIEAQDDPLNSKQLAYLERLLFGGMGSFNDLFLDQKGLGSAANTANERLNNKRHILYTSFHAP